MAQGALKLQDSCAWAPQPRQLLALLSPTEDLFFGGARGGGKSDWLLEDWDHHHDLYGGHCRGLLLRRTYDELEELQARAMELYPVSGGRYRATKRRWEWKDGARISFRYLARDEDASHYQGWSLDWLGADELTNFPSPEPIDKCRACLRSAYGIPCVCRSTGNPGGPGHNWVKARYVDPSPPGTPFWDDEQKTWRVYIPSRLDDNLILQRNDPLYWQRVEAAAAGRPDLLKAWRWGIWDIVAGGMFDDAWDPSVHILEPFPIPESWRIDRGFDWGSSRPFAVGWFGESDGTQAGNGLHYPRGTLFIWSELYGWTGKPNKGLDLSNREIVRQIKEIEAASGYAGRIKPGPADNMIFDVREGKSIASEMASAGVAWERSNKGPGSRITGWKAIRDRLIAAKQNPLEHPGLYVFKNCRNVIRTLPVLPRDKREPDDVDTEAEDHLGDMIRYRVSGKQRTGAARDIPGA